MSEKKIQNAEITCTVGDLQKEGIVHPLFIPGTIVNVYNDDVYGDSDEIVAEIANPKNTDLRMLIKIEYLNFLPNE